jgi:uncharacterized protein
MMTNLLPSSNIPKQPVLIIGDIEPFDDDCACSEILLADNKLAQAAAENDCACATIPGTLNNVKTHSGYYRAANEVFTLSLPKGFLLALPIASPTGPVIMDASAWSIYNSYREPHAVSNPVEQEMVGAGLLIASGENPSIKKLSSQSLTAWLHITNACNLDCPYCYVRKSNVTMPLATGRRALEDLFQTANMHHLGHIKLKYAGGEALLHFDLVRQLHAYALRLAKKYDLSLSAVLLSNGTRLDHVAAEWLVLTGIRLMISVDGIGADHDLVRSDRGGNGTFTQIERLIDRILIPSGIHPTISVTITRQNAHRVAQIVRWTLERDLPLSLNFYRLRGLGETGTALSSEAEAIITGILAAFEVVEVFLPERPILNGLLDRVRFGAHAATCGVGQGYLVITPQGRLAQCHMLLDEAIETEPGSSLLENSQSGRIRNLNVDQKENCQICSFRYYCTGGCPLETYRIYGRWDHSSPNCQIYRALIPPALRLEGLRLMKMHGYL